MERRLTRTSLDVEAAYYRDTNGSSENNRCLGFQAAFIDRETGTVYVSRFADGRVAPFHLLDGLPADLVRARDEQGRVTCVSPSVESGFVRDGRFFTRFEAAAVLEPALTRDGANHVTGNNAANEATHTPVASALEDRVRSKVRRG
jgi:hypothetical protein